MITGQKFFVQVIPVRSRIVLKIVFFGHFGQPNIGFMYKTDVRKIALGRIKGNNFKFLLLLSHKAIGNKKAKKQEAKKECFFHEEIFN